eukprot:SM000012S25319  [mRNA]  locus=s12:333757:337733:+ [translate_table: standard]
MLNMDAYDNEDADDAAGELRIFGNGGLGAAYYGPLEEDPHILDAEEDEEDVDDMTIRDSDLLILAARNEDEVSLLEVWVYEEGEAGSTAEEEGGNMYVHHDILLPAFPLALAWLDCAPSTSGDDSGGSFVAVGTMQPEIEIWDLNKARSDLVCHTFACVQADEVEPAVVLGGASVKKTKQNLGNGRKSKTVTVIQLRAGSHKGAVLGLSWNAEFRNVLASCSADKLVKVWDVVAGKCAHTMRHHADKVQAVAWNPTEPTGLLSGSFDKTTALVDMRLPDQAALRWSMSADVECLAWDPQTVQNFVVSTEDGLVCCYDVRRGSEPGTGSGRSDVQALYRLHAHDKATCSLSFNSVTPHMLATASTDKTVKIWDTTNDAPSCLTSINPKVGAIFSLSFCRDSPNLLAIGGSKGKLHVWNTWTSTAVANKTKSLLMKH